MWQLQSIEVNGGFLPGLKLAFPTGLTCIIGPRGSGKSTLAEIIRFAFRGSIGLSKARLDLLQTNLGSNGLITAHVLTSSGISYTLTRGLKQAPIITTADGRAIGNVELDRGTFLPLDSYSSAEIESIADETLGEKRRALLDDLRGDHLHTIQLTLGEQKRLLEANADQIKSQRRTISDIEERIEDVSDARAKLLALGPSPEGESTTEYALASKQNQTNERELERLRSGLTWIRSLETELASVQVLRAESALSLVEPGSNNMALLEAVEKSIRGNLAQAAKHLENALGSLASARGDLSKAEGDIDAVHAQQRAEYARLSELNEATGALIRARAFAEQQVAQLEQLENRRALAAQRLQSFLDGRSVAKAHYLAERENISTLRQSIAEALQLEAGENVRLRVMRHADDLTYRQVVLGGLRGAGVRNHDDILKSLMTLRPEQLAQIIASNDAAELESFMSFGLDRSRKILDALKEKIDPLELEVTTIEDQLRIELNVATGAERNYKDASELSRGQKCTALLPLLLARRDSPLVIDQPEDNLDNHFIYETIVSSIFRRKAKRQMIFITHNANIPVLAEAELVIVMNSDGKIGYVETSGSVDECRDEIIDLLEGGKEAFDRRSSRYART